MKVFKVDFAQPKRHTVVEHLTTISTIPLNNDIEPTDIALYRLAQQYAELKRICGHDKYDVDTQYKILVKDSVCDS